MFVLSTFSFWDTIVDAGRKLSLQGQTATKPNIIPPNPPSCRRFRSTRGGKGEGRGGRDKRLEKFGSYEMGLQISSYFYRIFSIFYGFRPLNPVLSPVRERGQEIFLFSAKSR
jgi:hypothetical protein